MANEWEIEARLRAVVERQRILAEIIRSLQEQLGKANQDLQLIRQAPGS